MTYIKRNPMWRNRLLIIASLLLFIGLLTVGCNLQQETPKGANQPENPSVSENKKENIIEVEQNSNTDTTTANNTIKIYKDNGDAVDAFYAASESGQPIFLYFYTDT